MRERERDRESCTNRISHRFILIFIDISPWETSLKSLRFEFIFMELTFVCGESQRKFSYFIFVNVERTLENLENMYVMVHSISNCHSRSGCDDRSGRFRFLTLVLECHVERNEYTHSWVLNSWDFCSHWQKWNLEIFFDFSHKQMSIPWKWIQTLTISNLFLKVKCRWKSEWNDVKFYLYNSFDLFFSLPLSFLN